MVVTVLGGGIAGLTCAVELAERGAAVQVLERSSELGGGAGCSWFAGGMLAPGCELESAPDLIAQLGAESINWWRKRLPDTRVNGTLVLAHPRDASQLTQFSRRTRGYEWLDGSAIAALEPDLAGRFNRALFFPDEGHLDPRRALATLVRHLDSLGVSVRYGNTDVLNAPPAAHGSYVDCTGMAAKQALGDLRGVKGEMLIVRLPDISLSRPIRVLHPRIPVYVVPRGAGTFMIGATVIESEQPTRITARSMLELLTAAYALHPAFGEAEIVEIGTGVRPAFPDNLPRIRWLGNTLYVNGLYRHGFLVAPALARRVAETLLHGHQFPEITDESHGERRLA